MKNNQVKSINAYYNKLEQSNDDANQWLKWSDTRTRFSKKKANRFFIWVMLNMGQKAERAQRGSSHLIENYFNTTENFWQEILSTPQRSINKICMTGFDGKGYAANYNYRTFPKRLKSAASQIVKNYDSDVRNIWDVTPDNVSDIYTRFLDFDGIGDALAKMAQFTLVRGDGVAGGKANQGSMSIKPDILVRRVLFRTGITDTQSISTVVQEIGKLNLKSPADFDAAAWLIGRDYCKNSTPNCEECPLNKSCNYYAEL